MSLGSTAEVPHPFPVLAMLAVQHQEVPSDPGLPEMKSKSYEPSIKIIRSVYRFALRVPDSFVDRNNQARSLNSTADSVELDEAGFPDKRFKVVANALGTVNVHTNPLRPVGMHHAKLVEDVRRVEARIVADLPRDNFEGLRESKLDKLEFSRDLQSMFPDVRRKVHLKRSGL